jgi:hypothetical protein
MFNPDAPPVSAGGWRVADERNRDSLFIDRNPRIGRSNEIEATERTFFVSQFMTSDGWRRHA